MTDQLQQTNPNEHRYYPEDEIELIDILRVIWKRKYLILAGTIACGLIAAIISLSITKIYSVDMVLKPGILSVGENGNNVYIDSSQNIKALIESGAFDNNILEYFKNNNGDNIPQKLRFKVTIPKQSDAIKVRYETADFKQGIVLQNHLSKLLLENYKNLVEYYKSDRDMKLNFLKSENESLKKTILSYKRNGKNIEERINELTSEIELIKNNTDNLIIERNKLLLKNPKKNILSYLLYSYIIQQNLQLSNRYKGEINDYKQKKEKELREIEKSKNIIAKKSKIILNLQFKKDHIQNIQILQKPTRSAYPIKPKTMLNTIIALSAGFFFFLFLSLFLGYLKGQKVNSTYVSGTG
jgi:capsular polysaccharide biosynthesis protein